MLGDSCPKRLAHFQYWNSHMYQVGRMTMSQMMDSDSFYTTFFNSPLHLMFQKVFSNNQKPCLPFVAYTYYLYILPNLISKIEEQI